jgi:2-polyprenyl-3-methyl-5-hydroxy-6-metoxy-1,4-benzoquinol methylase
MSNNRKLAPKVWQPTYLLNRALARTIQNVANDWFSREKTSLILDIGCGSMPYRELFAGKCDKYTGCDLHSKDPSVIECRADKLIFPNDSFDGALCFQVLEHTERPELVLADMARILKPNGIGIVTVPFIFPYHASPGDFLRFTAQGISSLVETFGLTVEALETQCTTHQTLTMILNLKIVEFTGKLKQFRITRPAMTAIELVTIALLNVLAIAIPTWKQKSPPKGFAVYANTAIVFRKC